jgi:hypothetical protein
MEGTQMRLTYKRSIVLHLGRQETKLWNASEAYKAEVTEQMADMANSRGCTVELVLSARLDSPDMGRVVCWSRPVNPRPQGAALS